MCVKKDMGADNIPPKIIKWAPELFAPILSKIFNKCIHIGYYPKQLKVARVVPVHKGGDSNDINNYRPISVLTQFNRLFERVLATRLMSFFEKNKIITSKQFGFLKRHSTEHAILDLKEFIMESLSKKKITAVLFLDLKKAFDTVSHKILLKKLHHYGIRGVPHDLLKSYLSDRQQYTSIDGTNSGLDFIRWGVPQGSVLGPILFLLFINDLPNSTSMNPWLFADDTALAQTADTFTALQTYFNEEINKVQNWLLANNLSVHYAKKTQYILFIPPSKKSKKPNDFAVTMGRNPIEQTATYKYLGVIIDENLNWKPQIDKLCSKLAGVCGIISKVRHILDRNSLLMIYNSLMESRLRYRILGWSTASNALIDRLKVLQNRAICFIDFSPIGTTILPIFAQFNVLPLEKIIDLERANYMFSLNNGNLPEVFNFYCSKPTHRYETRFSRNNFCIPKYQPKLSNSSIKFIGPKAWEKIPSDLKNLQFRKTFSKQLKRLYLNELPTEKRTRIITLNSPTDNDFSLTDLFDETGDETSFSGF